MGTTAQDALQAFEDNWTTTSWDAMTDVQKTTHIFQHYALKIAAAKEVQENQIEEQTQQSESEAARLTAISNALSALGYNCDNSQADWYKLYNKPKIYGANWQAQADYQISISTGASYFLKHAYNILYNNYQLNFWYDAGDTFFLNGQLYEVIQGHTTQADWNPETTPALYKKAVLADEIPVWVQSTGAHDVYMKGDKVRFPDVSSPVWESLIDNNSWSPVAYPAGWEMI